MWRKVDFSDVQSYYLARFLADFQPDAPVSLIGYSLGARVATGAMELLAGGSIADRRLPAEVVVRRARQHPRPFRVVLMAAACDADWLLPDHRDGQALSLVDRMLVTTDARDPAMKWYSRLYGRGGPEALGYAGPCCLPQPGSCGKIELIDVSCSVGRRHDWDIYATAPELASAWAGTRSSRHPTALRRGGSNRGRGDPRLDAVSLAWLRTTFSGLFLPRIPLG